MTETTSGIVLILIGLMIVIGSALNWRLVTRSGKLLNMLLGDTIARAIYIIVGILLILMGLSMLIGLNWFG